MSRKLLFSATLFLGTFPLFAQSTDEIVSKYISARGGIDKITAVKTERVSGTISLGPDADCPFVVERKRPLRMHMEIVMSGQTVIRVFDGKSAGWIYNPFVRAVQPMSENDLKNIVDEADFDGPFVNYKEKGNQVEFIDRADIVGKPAYKVKLTNKNGEVSFFYFDAATALLLKWEGNRKVEGKDMPWESFFRDFREVNGLKYPFLVDADAPGTDQSQKIVAEKIEVNIPLDDARFDKPIAPDAGRPASPPGDPSKPN